MGIANKLTTGHRQTVAEGINTKELEFLKAKEMLFNGGDPIILKGFFIQSGKYGKSVTLVAMRGEDPYGINIPKRYVKMFETLTDEEVEDIKAGKLGIGAIEAMETNNGNTVAITFVDL